MKKALSHFLTPFLTIILILASFVSVHSQSAQDTIQASQHFKKGDSLLIATKFEESIILTNQALDLYLNAKSWEKVANSYNNLSEAYWRLFKLQKSLQSSQKALDICNKYLPKTHKQRASAFINLAQYYYRVSEHQKSINYLDQAIDVYQKTTPTNQKGIGVAYNILANNYYDLSDYSKSLEYHKKALHINKETRGECHINVGIAYNNMGNTYGRLGEFYKSIECYQSFLDIVLQNFDDNHLYAAFSYLNIGTSYIDLMRLDLAMENYEKALPIFSKENNKYGLLKTHHGMGNVFDGKGQANKAIDFFNKSISIGTELYGKKNPEIAYNYMNIGKIYADLYDYENALFYYNNALSIFQKVYPDDHEIVAILQGNLGNTLFYTETPEKALEQHLKALQTRKRIYDDKNIKIAASYANLANHYSKRKLYKEAVDYQKKSLNQITASLGKHHLNSTEDYHYLGNHYSQLDEYGAAIISYNNSLIANSKNNTHPDSISVFRPESYQNHTLLLETMRNKAFVLQNLYRNSENVNHLEEAITLYKNADKSIDYIRRSYQNHQDKLSFSKETKEVYTGAIEAQVLLFKHSNNNNALKDAFYYTEKSKANTLKELLTDSNAKNVSGLSSNILNLEKDLKTNRAFFQSQLINERSNTIPDTFKMKTLETQLFDIDRKQDSIAMVLQLKYPKYYQLKHQNKITKVSEIQQKLGHNNTLLEFFVKDSTTYAFVLSKYDINVIQLATPKLSNKINQFRNAITTKNISEYKESAHLLYQELIEPLEDKLIGDELIIIPDGSLWHLNFELLLTQKNNSNNPIEFAYLLNNYAISYSNSANLLFNPFKSRQQQSKKLKECLAFSFTDSTNVAQSKNMSLATLRDTGDDLPGTRKEIKAISEIIDGQYYFGSEAVEANFKENAAQYNILHLALHGEVDNERPENSKLFFTKNKDTIEDNLLYSHELFALNIPAELTVLSACNTGIGKIAKGEGIMSLGNAFQYAGTKSLLLSSWEVSDQTTPELMKLFYTNLKKGMSKPKALQQAKLQFLKTANIQRTAPFYWGGFYLVGDSNPMVFNSNFTWYRAVGFGFLVILLISLIYYRQKRNNQTL